MRGLRRRFRADGARESAPPAAAREVALRSFWWVAGSLVVVVVVGAFGPWAQRFGLTVDSSDNEFVGFVALVAAVALVVFAVTRNTRLATVPLLAGLVLTMLIGHDLNDPAGPFGGPGPNIDLEWGIWLALGGSIGLVIASAFLIAETASKTKRGKRRLVGGRHEAVATSESGKLIRTSVQTRVLGAFSNDAVLRDFARRLSGSYERGSELLAELIAQVRLEAVASLVDELTPTGELDYAPHRIDLLVSSPQIAPRLAAVEKEPFTIEWIERSIAPGDVFYDIGANVGPYSLIAAKATGNRARIFAFEPSPSSFRDLARNVLLNDCAESIVPLPLALWSKNGLLSFSFRSLSPGPAKHRVSSHLRMTKRLTAKVIGVRLDDLVERFGLPVPAHAKIDVDGDELEVLRGARRTLFRLEWRSIIIELDRGETERNRAIKLLLREAGFDSGRRHERTPSLRYPDPTRRRDVYWTFTRLGVLEQEERFTEPELSDAQRRALDSLRTDGVAVLKFSDLFHDPSIWAELEGDMREFVTSTERDLPSLTEDDRKELYEKSFLVRRFRTRKGQQRVRHRPSNPWLRFGVSPQLLGIVNAYRGRLMKLNDMDSWYTVPNPRAGERVASQRWHRDGWEENLVKVFTYFSEVGEEAGPLQYVRGSTGGGKYGSLWPWTEKEVYPPQDELAREIDEADCVSLTGPPGTIVVCDTSGFHRGGFARTKPRILSYHTYISREAQQRHRRKFDVEWSSPSQTLSAASRFALD